MLKLPNVKGERGITILALSVTIIVLLILAGISIATLTGDNGIIKNVGQAKEQVKIENEKEILESATISAIDKSRYGDIEEEEFRNQLNKKAGEGKTELSVTDDKFEVLFNESNRYYEIDRDGNIGDAQIVVKDMYPGDIKKDINGNTLDGSAEHPYEINCIEDLVALSNMINVTGYRLEDGEAIAVTSSDRFFGKYIVLNRNLNFKSSFSYTNSERTDFGDINGDDTDGNKLITEMTTGMGFNPIGIDNDFQNNFDGQGHKLENIYENERTLGGIFGNISGNFTIKNLGVTGVINTSDCGGGIAGIARATGNSSVLVQIVNCYSKAKINGTFVGGIIGHTKPGGDKYSIEGCYNTGKVEGTSGAGGIIGNAYSQTTITNCYNNGDIIYSGTSAGANGAGGISGASMFGTKILNCYNVGNVINGLRAGGVTGFNYWSETKIINCYNLANSMSGTNIGGMIGNANISKELLIMKNCYYLNTLANKGLGNWSDETANPVEKSAFTNGSFINEFNSYIENGENNEESVDTSNWKKWKMGENGYPVFE